MSSWFSLFFIPVFAYRKKHFMICPVCGLERELGAEALEELKPYAELNEQFRAGGISRRQYLERRRGLSGRSVGVSKS